MECFPYFGEVHRPVISKRHKDRKRPGCPPVFPVPAPAQVQEPFQSTPDTTDTPEVTPEPGVEVLQQPLASAVNHPRAALFETVGPRLQGRGPDKFHDPQLSSTKFINQSEPTWHCDSEPERLT